MIQIVVAVLFLLLVWAWWAAAPGFDWGIFLMANSFMTGPDIEYLPDFRRKRRHRSTGGAGGSSLPLAMQSIPPDVYLNFTTNTIIYKSGNQFPAAPALSVSRASSGTVNDSSGNWTQVGANLPRMSNLGLLVEESRTNSIRNNSMAGAIVMADGVELTTNGNFTSAGSGWTTNTTSGTSAVSFAIGSVTITGDNATNNTYITQRISGLTIGRSYVFSYSGPPGGFFNIGVGTSAGASDTVGLTQTATNGTASNLPDRVAFTATATSHWITVARFANTANVINSISVQDGERCQNGGFTSSPINASQSTVQNGWAWSRAAGVGTVTYVPGTPNKVQIVGDGTNEILAYVAVPTVAGFIYTITVDIGLAQLSVGAGTTPSGTTLLGVSGNVGTAQKFQFTATGTTTYVNFHQWGAATATLANVSVQSAGLLPTFWGTYTPGLLQQVVGLGTYNGVACIDVRTFGTTTTQFMDLLVFEFGGTIPATYGQTWTCSFFFAWIGGTTNNLAAPPFGCGIQGNNSGVGYVDNIGTAVSPSLGGPLTRYNCSFTPPDAAVAFVQPMLYLSGAHASGDAVDVTVRVGWPQLENNTLITSTLASAAIAAAGSGGTAGTAVYQIGGGTGTAATLNVTIAGGVLSAINSVANAGSYTVFPPSPAALTYVSGTGTGLVGATVNLTPTNLAANAFATSPIITSAAAAARNADVVTLTTLPTPGSAWTHYHKATPQAPTTYSVNQYMVALDDNEDVNARLVHFRGLTNGIINYRYSVGGSNVYTGGQGSGLAQNAQYKAAIAATAGDQQTVLNGVLGAAGSGAGTMATPLEFRFGSNATSASFFNGFLAEAGLWASQRISNANLQAITT